MKMLLKINGIFLVLAILLASCSETDDPAAEDNMGKMDDDEMMKDDAVSAPDFSLTSVDGSTISLSNYDGKVLVMFFFGNSCPSCVAVAPSVQTQIVDQFKSNTNFAIIGLDQWDGSQASVESFKNKTGVSFPLLLNASSTASDYGTTYDRFVVVDKEGKIRFKGTRGASNDIADVVSTVQNYLN